MDENLNDLMNGSTSKNSSLSFENIAQVLLRYGEGQ